ncbi:S-adenosyl-L-methionine-dependent methyltransferase [Phlyctochytrium arcticum]|nr:S-adenosyl-L-methionine-dependent methyltransferase [Phlyctochytrium arcticum]
MPQLVSHLPQGFTRYFEPFVGGASMLFCMGNIVPELEYHINNLESSIINVYQAVKSDHLKLLTTLDSLDQKKTKQDFINLVNIFNQRSLVLRKAGIYIYLTKLAFNSNLKHRANAIKPTYSKSSSLSPIHNEENIREIHQFMRNVTISNQDYNIFMGSFDLRSTDCIFLDPPYLVQQVNEYYQSIFHEKSSKTSRIYAIESMRPVPSSINDPR